MVYLKEAPTLRVDEERCTWCGVCLDVCPRQALELVDRKARITDLDRCIECGACRINCRYEAISVRSGVGCASALIGSLKSGGEPTCGCDGESGNSCCG